MKRGWNSRAGRDDRWWYGQLWQLDFGPRERRRKHTPTETGRWRGIDLTPAGRRNFYRWKKIQAVHNAIGRFLYQRSDGYRPPPIRNYGPDR